MDHLAIAQDVEHGSIHVVIGALEPTLPGPIRLLGGESQVRTPTVLSDSPIYGRLIIIRSSQTCA
jgi:hypothetical protein